MPARTTFFFCCTYRIPCASLLRFWLRWRRRSFREFSTQTIPSQPYCLLFKFRKQGLQIKIYGRIGRHTLLERLLLLLLWIETTTVVWNFPRFSSAELHVYYMEHDQVKRRAEGLTVALLLSGLENLWQNILLRTVGYTNVLEPCIFRRVERQGERESEKNPGMRFNELSSRSIFEGRKEARGSRREFMHPSSLALFAHTIH